MSSVEGQNTIFSSCPDFVQVPTLHGKLVTLPLQPCLSDYSSIFFSTCDRDLSTGSVYCQLFTVLKTCKNTESLTYSTI